MPGATPLRTKLLLLSVTAALAFAFDEPKPARGLPRPAKSEPFFFTPAGFDREGKPATADGKPAGRLRVVVRDHATGKPTHCRLNVVGPDGNFYQPKTNHLSPYALT